MNARERRPLEWSTSLLGIAAILVVMVGWFWVGWPVLVAAGVAMVVVRVL